MMGRSNADPVFEKPPVVEVATSIQFDMIDALDTTKLGLLWLEYQDRYPKLELHPALEETKEEFELPSKSRMRFTVAESFPPPRLWFLNAEGTRLIQVQNNRFIVNWRRLATEERYPRYSGMRELLDSELRLFRDFLARESIPEVVPNQVELTYVNHIEFPKGSSREPLEKYVTLWSGWPQGTGLPPNDSVGIEARYTIADNAQARGRLYVEVSSRVRITDGSPLYAVQLTFRGRPSGPSIGESFDFLDSAHEWITRAFLSLTTMQEQRAWGKK